MELFYIEDPKEEITLNTEESKHIIKVLKKNESDILNLTNGKGTLYQAKIIFADSKKCKLRIVSCQKKQKQHSYYLHIAIAPTKNMSRFEFFLEKATEIGVDEITPIYCSNSERKIIKIERCKRILQAAVKQSLKYYMPKLNEAIYFNNFIRKDFLASKYIAHCEDNNKMNLISINKKNNKIMILIGPEGDFSTQEIKLALNNGFEAVSLNNCRLRTETAGIVSVQIINTVCS